MSEPTTDLFRQINSPFGNLGERLFIRAAGRDLKMETSIRMPNSENDGPNVSALEGVLEPRGVPSTQDDAGT